MRQSIATLFCATLAVAVSGCTHLQLTRNTALTATTVSSIQYRMVLDNIAAMSCEPGTLPAHVRLADGTVQISNQLGFGDAGGFTWFRGGDFGVERYGPFGSTRVSEQWGTDAVEDPIQLWELQSLYRRVLDMPPLPEPNFIAEAMRARIQRSAKNGSTGRGGESSENSSGDSGEMLPEPEQIAKGNPVEVYDDAPPKLPQPIAASSRSASIEDEANSANPIASRVGVVSVDQYDIPVGWFCLGRKCDVPKNACYVGCHKGRYAWVTPEGVEGLAQFTLAVLSVTKLEAAEAGRSGLMFTP